ncbi:hypothetical protein [Methylobacterium sp. 10]|uniref:hypothetical protein n=1 Tax=Methylobacterium sp. 10 TaxID=1101191 RepID=UPI0012DC4B70|nr:hypothetical protein [Methylobacterium sp. 10]
MAKPVLVSSPTKVPAPPKPQRAVQDQKLWTFSFRYWKQHDLFGLGVVDGSWLASFLEKLHDLSSKPVSYIYSDPAVKVAWRYHSIDWNAKNVPMARSDFSWVDEDYRNNPEEYEFYQFQISMALGRVIGFWDENRVFNILLVDRMHNLQPSNYSDYKIRDCPVVDNKFTELLATMQTRIDLCQSEECHCRDICTELQQDLIHKPENPAILVPVNTELYGKCINCLDSGLAESMADLLSIAVGSFE